MSNVEVNCKFSIYDLNGYNLIKLFDLVNVNLPSKITQYALSQLDSYMLEKYNAHRLVDNSQIYNSYYLFPNLETKTQFILSVF